jgi:DNA-binding transcriptional LysR family regulator
MKSVKHCAPLPVHGSQPTADLIDLNDLRVFAYVASLASFSLAAVALRMHKSSVSRSIARLETALDKSLIYRTTRTVRLTRHGMALKKPCDDVLTRINETIGYAGSVKSSSGFTDQQTDQMALDSAH